jgi:hypothetical protein
MNWEMGLITFLLLAFSTAQAQQPRSAQWKDFDFLIGDWTWSGGGQPGQAKGTSAFEPDLNGTVLLRKVHLDYPASKDRAAFSHDDVLYVYRDPADNSLRAIFFDGENHVIRYAVTVSAGGDSILFLSDAAPPGKPDQFATYVEFAAKKIGK